MANTSFHGKNGRAYFAYGESDAVRMANVKSWSADITAETADATCMDDDWRSHRAGFKDWTGTVEMNVSTAGLGTNFDLSQLGDADDGTSPCVLELWFGDAASDGYLTGDVICTGLSVTTSATDVVTVTASFQGNGQITFDDE